MTITMQNFKPTATVGLAVEGEANEQFLDMLKSAMPEMIVIDPASPADVDAVIFVVGFHAALNSAMEGAVMQLARADFEAGAQLPIIGLADELGSKDLSPLHPHLLSWVWRKIPATHDHRPLTKLVDQVTIAAQERALVHCFARKVRGVSPL